MVCEKDIETIINWGIEDPEGVLRFMAERWRWDHYWASKDGLWVFATGGWSEHEMMLGALQNSVLWRVYLGWHSLYIPGGLLIVATNDKAAEKLERLLNGISRWAWKQAGRAIPE